MYLFSLSDINVRYKNSIKKTGNFHKIIKLIKEKYRFSFLNGMHMKRAVEHKVV